MSIFPQALFANWRKFCAWFLTNLKVTKSRPSVWASMRALACMYTIIILREFTRISSQFSFDTHLSASLILHCLVLSCNIVGWLYRGNSTSGRLILISYALHIDAIWNDQTSLAFATYILACGAIVFSRYNWVFLVMKNQVSWWVLWHLISSSYPCHTCSASFMIEICGSLSTMWLTWCVLCATEPAHFDVLLINHLLEWWLILHLKVETFTRML